MFKATKKINAKLSKKMKKYPLFVTVFIGLFYVN